MMFGKLIPFNFADVNEPGIEIYMIIIGVVVALAVTSIIITKIVKNKKK